MANKKHPSIPTKARTVCASSLKCQPSSPQDRKPPVGYGEETADILLVPRSLRNHRRKNEKTSYTRKKRGKVLGPREGSTNFALSKVLCALRKFVTKSAF